MMRNRFLWAAPALIAIGFAAAAMFRRPSSTPFSRGARLAEKQGCFACHGPGGRSGAPNPKAESDIPSWDGGSAMMYLENDGHIREYIALGHRKDKPEIEEGLIRMPAYGKSLSEKEIDALTAYVKGVSSFYPEMPDSVRPGLETAQETGCFSCHGPSGRGGVRNPGSFKGLIPGWDDPKFKELARDDNEVGEWIRTGTLRRLEKNPVAGFFLRRQRLKMPSYDSVLTENQVLGVIRYIAWMQEPVGN